MRDGRPCFQHFSSAGFPAVRFRLLGLSAPRLRNRINRFDYFMPFVELSHFPLVEFHPYLLRIFHVVYQISMDRFQFKGTVSNVVFVTTRPLFESSDETDLDQI
jgi:hypothetical protein